MRTALLVGGFLEDARFVSGRLVAPLIGKRVTTDISLPITSLGRNVKFRECVELL
jgi:hypothetical protein